MEGENEIFNNCFVKVEAFKRDREFRHRQLVQQQEEANKLALAAAAAAAAAALPQQVEPQQLSLHNPQSSHALAQLAEALAAQSTAGGTVSPPTMAPNEVGAVQQQTVDAQQQQSMPQAVQQSNETDQVLPAAAAAAVILPAADASAVPTELVTSTVGQLSLEQLKAALAKARNPQNTSK